MKRFKICVAIDKEKRKLFAYSDSFLRPVVVCMLATKGGAAMYDYMKALQDRFDHQEHTELDEQVKCAQEELRCDMDAAGRRKLLRLIDTQNSSAWTPPAVSFAYRSAGAAFCAPRHPYHAAVPLAC